MLTRSQAGWLGYEKSAQSLAERNRSRRVAARERHAAQTKACGTCGKPIPYESRANTFCGHACAARTNHARRPMKKRCKRCGNPIPHRRRYCIDCGIEAASSRRATVLTAATDATRRYALLRERGRRCEVCGLAEWRGQPIPIQMDHIDGNSDNNSPENLRLLCPNCHAQTPTFTRRNKGNSRSKRNIARRERYHGVAPQQHEGRADHS